MDEVVLIRGPFCEAETPNGLGIILAFLQKYKILGWDEMGWAWMGSCHHQNNFNTYC
jgi:hypothetical protein